MAAAETRAADGKEKVRRDLFLSDVEKAESLAAVAAVAAAAAAARLYK